MVKHGAPQRFTPHSSRSASNISSFLRDLSLQEQDRRPPAPGTELPAAQPQSGPSDRFPDRVYLQAAAIFQNTHQEKDVAHRLISYGERSGVPVPEAEDEASQRQAYELAFNTLKCE